MKHIILICLIILMFTSLECALNEVNSEYSDIYENAIHITKEDKPFLYTTSFLHKNGNPILDELVGVTKDNFAIFRKKGEGADPDKFYFFNGYEFFDQSHIYKEYPLQIFEEEIKKDLTVIDTLRDIIFFENDNYIKVFGQSVRLVNDRSISSYNIQQSRRIHSDCNKVIYLENESYIYRIENNEDFYQNSEIDHNGLPVSESRFVIPNSKDIIKHTINSNGNMLILLQDKYLYWGENGVAEYPIDFGLLSTNDIKVCESKGNSFVVYYETKESTVFWKISKGEIEKKVIIKADDCLQRVVKVNNESLVIFDIFGESKKPATSLYNIDNFKIDRNLAKKLGDRTIIDVDVTAKDVYFTISNNWDAAINKIRNQFEGKDYLWGIRNFASNNKLYEYDNELIFISKISRSLKILKNGLIETFYTFPGPNYDNEIMYKTIDINSKKKLASSYRFTQLSYYKKDEYSLTLTSRKNSQIIVKSDSSFIIIDYPFNDSPHEVYVNKDLCFIFSSEGTRVLDLKAMISSRESRFEYEIRGFYRVVDGVHADFVSEDSLSLLSIDTLDYKLYPINFNNKEMKYKYLHYINEFNCLHKDNFKQIEKQVDSMQVALKIPETITGKIKLDESTFLYHSATTVYLLENGTLYVKELINKSDTISSVRVPKGDLIPFELTNGNIKYFSLSYKDFIYLPDNNYANIYCFNDTLYVTYPDSSGTSICKVPLEGCMNNDFSKVINIGLPLLKKQEVKLLHAGQSVYCYCRNLSKVWQLKNDKAIEIASSERDKIDYIWDVLVDKNDKLWIVQQHNLLKYIEELDRFTTYDTNDYLPDQICRCTILKNNTFILVTDGGVYKFKEPTDGDYSIIVESNVQTRILYSNLNTRLYKSIFNDYRSVIFEYSDKNKVKVFASYNSLNNLRSVEYSFWLEGYDDDWSTFSKNNFKDYGILPLGRYTLKLRILSPSGNIIEQKSIPFVVIPNIIKIIIYTLIVLLLVTMLIIFIIKYRVRYLNKSKEKLEELVLIRTQELEEEKLEVMKSNNLINSSITYAATLQRSILPSDKEVCNFVKEYFSIYLPKDRVSGDFIWFYQIDKDRAICAVVDCTGHGVPGALLTIAANSIMNNVLKDSKFSSINECLEEIDNRIRNLVRDKDTGLKAGLDIGIVLIDKTIKEIEFIGARCNMFLRKDNEKLQVIKGTKRSIGDTKDIPFEAFQLSYDNQIELYLSTDGIYDMAVIEDGARKRFKQKGLIDFINQHRNISLATAKDGLSKTISDCHSQHSQRDDITVVGIRI